MTFKTVPMLAVLTIVAVSSACRSEPAKAPGTAPGKPLTIESKSSAATNVTALMDKLSPTSPPAQGSRAAALVRAVAKPAAESPRIEQPASARPLERSGAEVAASRAAVLLPPVTDELKGVRIGWYVNHSIDAFRQAIDSSKPLVLVVAEETCSYCTDLVTDVLRCPAVNRWAGEAVFAYSNHLDDRGANTIAESLKTGGYPAITVLEPESRVLLERGRINGYFDATPLGDHLESILRKTPPRRLPVDFDANASENQKSSEPTKPTAPATGPATGDYSKMFTDLPPTALGVILSWEKLGLKHVAPAPNCK